MAFYKGFSTIGTDSRFSLDDVELIKRDLLNHFNTRRGERAMLPNFGSMIWEMMFDGLTAELRDAVIADATRIVASDPRVALRQIDIREFEHGFQIDMDLYIITLDVAEMMYVQFADNANTMSSI